MALTPLCLLMASLAVASAGSGLTLSGGNRSMFPPLQVCDREAQHSPYRVSLTQGDSPDQVCFRVDVVKCDSTWMCCDANLDVFQLDANIAAKSNIKAVYVDGAPRTYSFDTHISVLRVSLGKTKAQAASTTVCVETTGLKQLSDICRPQSEGPACKVALLNRGLRRECCPVLHLSPAHFQTLKNQVNTAAVSAKPIADPSFPHARCHRGAAPFTLAEARSRVNAKDATTEHCFVVASTGNTEGVCGNMDVTKIEFDVNSQCHGSLAYTSVNGVKRPPFFQLHPYSTIKVMHLDLASPKAVGTTICLGLKMGSHCASLETLCKGGVCTAALFGRPQGNEYRCCPVVQPLRAAA